MVTCDFGLSSLTVDPFLLGVVFDDLDQDGLYSAGEGVGGVVIRTAAPGDATLTASAGGYGLPLAPGDYIVEAELPDGRMAEREASIGAGNVKVDFLLSEFAHPKPEITIATEPQFIQAGESVTLSWASDHADTASIDNGIGNVNLAGSITLAPSATTTYTIAVAGQGGSAEASATVWVGELPDPPAPSIWAAPSAIAKGETVTLSWSVIDARTAYINNGVGLVPTEGSVQLQPAHSTTYTLTATNTAGSANAKVRVTVTGNPEAPPEGSFGYRYEDLIPPDATILRYDPRRFALVTGQVHDIAFNPLPGVTITIHDHPQYGSVFTDADGRFTIPAEGGGVLTVVYEKQGRLTLHRKVAAPWGDIVIADPVQMMAEDPAETRVLFNGDPDAVVAHKASLLTDEHGERAVTMLFTGDNRAIMVDENGDDILALDGLTTRATEYTTLASMPAVLPPNSGYTYCVELSVDGGRTGEIRKTGGRAGGQLPGLRRGPGRARGILRPGQGPMDSRRQWRGGPAFGAGLGNLFRPRPL